MWCFMSCWSVPSSRKKNIFEDLFHVMHLSTKYSWIKPKWNIWANHCNLWLRLWCQSIVRLGADLNVVSTWIWLMLCFNGLHRVHSYHFMLWLRTNQQTPKDGPVSGGILQQNIGKVDAELILNIIRKVWCLASFCVALPSWELSN